MTIVVLGVLSLTMDNTFPNASALADLKDQLWSKPHYPIYPSLGQFSLEHMSGDLESEHLHNLEIILFLSKYISSLFYIVRLILPKKKHDPLLLRGQPEFCTPDCSNFLSLKSEEGRMSSTIKL